MKTIDTITVVIIERNKNDADAILHELQKSTLNFACTTVDTLPALRSELLRAAPDIILSDFSVSGHEEYATLALRTELTPQTPFIIVSRAIDEEHTLALIEKGVTDFVLKDALYTLPGKITRALNEYRTRRHAEHLEQKLMESDMRFREIFDLSPIPYALNDDNQRIIYLNQAFTTTFGYNLSDLPTLSDWWIKAYPDSEYRQWIIEEWTKRLTKAKAENREFEPLEVNIVCKNGTIRTVMVETGLLSQEFDHNHLVTFYDITDIKRSKEELQQSNIRFEMAVAATNDIVWDWNPQSDSIWWNNNFYTLFGYNRNDIESSSTSWSDNIYPADKQRVLAGIQATLEQKLLYWTDEYRFLKADGSFSYVYDRAFITYDTNGDPTRMVGAMQDITNRKHTEKTLRLRERAIQSVHSGIVITNPDLPDNPIIFANQGFYDMTGYRPEDVLGKNCRFLQGKDTNPGSIAEIKESISRHEPFKGEVLNYKKDGTPFWNMLRIAPILNRHGKVTHYVGVQNDVTERKIIENSLRDSEHKYRSVIATMQEGIIIQNEKGEIVDANTSAQLILGLTLDQLQGQTSYDSSWRAIHEDGTDYCTDMHPAVITLRTGEPVTGAIIGVYKPEGNLIWVSVNSQALFTHGRSTPDGVVVTFTDITEQRKSTQALAESENHLRTVLQTEPECIKLLNKKGEVQEMNSAGLAMIEADSLEQIQGKSVLHIINEPYRKQFTELIKDVFQGKSGNLEFEITGLKSHTQRWLHTNAVPLKDVDGNILSLLAVTSDITTQKKQHKELLTNKSRLRSIFESAMDAIITVDAEFKILLFNSAAEKMFLCSAQDAIGSPLERFIPERFRSYHADKMQKFGLESTNSRLMGNDRQVSALRTNGEEFPAEASISHADSEAGKLYSVILRDITEKKAAQDKLLHSEEKFRTVVQNISDIITLVNAQGIILYESPAITTILGYEQDEIIGRSIFEFIHTDDIELVAQRFQENLNAPLASKQVQYRFLAKNGEYVVLESSGINQLDNPAIGALVVTSRDMTERTLAEENLRRSEERFRAIIENSKVGFTLFDENMKSLYDSPTNEKIFGYSPHEFNEINRFTLIQPENREKINARIRQLLAGEEVEPIQMQWQHKNGTWKWIESNAFNYLNTKNLNAILVTYQDVSYRYESEKKIREQAALLDIVSDAIIMRDLEHNIISWSAGAENMYGWTAEETIGKSAPVLLGISDDPEFLEAKKILHQQGEWSGELRHRTKDGSTILVHSRLKLLYDSSNTPNAVLVTNTDITEKKSLETQLFRAQRLESIGTLASGIAHDLNNILTPVILGMELIKLKLPDESSRKRVDTVISTVKRGSGLIGQVLAFARGSQEDKEPINIKYIIDEVAKIARETFPREIDVLINLPSDDLIINGNATQIHQIMMNLCINARDAMNAKGGTLSIEAGYILAGESLVSRYVDAKPGMYVHIIVRDTGVGIPHELQEKIFEPFYTTKEVGKGTGIGLTTVFSIVRNHGGFIGLYSEENNGTAFSIYLPADIPKMVDEAESSSDEQYHSSGETILLVDDEDLIRNIADDILKAYGYKVLTAKNGAEAVQVYTAYNNEISAVITDVMMPVMGGIELMGILRGMNPDVRLIAASGVVHGDTSKNLKAAGAQVILLKPFTVDKLLSALHEVLG